MNRKFEDKLVRLAFGETNPRESSALERKMQSDPEAVRALEEYQSLKIGLNLLMDIPADQLSKERLQNAILGQGLKPIPIESPSRWGWTWMPAAAAAIAFGWIGIRHMGAPGSTAGPRIVMSPTSVARNESAAPVLKTPVFAHVAAQRKPGLVAKPEQDLTDQLVSKPQEDEESAKVSLAVNKLTDKSKPIQVVVKTPPQNPPQSVADQSDPAGKLAGINRPLVVINPESDNNSGAQKATEVDGASDVGPVGG